MQVTARYSRTFTCWPQPLRLFEKKGAFRAEICSSTLRLLCITSRDINFTNGYSVYYTGTYSLDILFNSSKSVVGGI